LLIKSFRKSHDKKGIGCDQNNTSTGTSLSYSIALPRLFTSIPTEAFKNKPFRKTNQKGTKVIWVPKNKIIPLANMLNPSSTTPVMVHGQ